jgi:hypothetical protein
MSGGFAPKWSAHVRDSLTRAVLDGAGAHRKLTPREALAAAREGKIKGLEPMPQVPGLQTLRDWVRKEQRAREARGLQANGMPLTHAIDAELGALVMRCREDREMIERDTAKRGVNGLLDRQKRIAAIAANLATIRRAVAPARAASTEKPAPTGNGKDKAEKGAGSGLAERVEARAQARADNASPNATENGDRAATGEPSAEAAGEGSDLAVRDGA